MTVRAKCARTLFFKNHFKCAQSAPDIFVYVESLMVQIEVDSTGRTGTTPDRPPSP